MRKLVVTCDVCKHPVDDFNGGVTVAGGWGETVRADACSIKCVVLLLKGLAAEIEEKGEKIMAENAAFLKANPGATVIRPSVAGEMMALQAAVVTKNSPATSPAVAAVVAKAVVDNDLVTAVTKSVDAELAELEARGPSVAGCAACDTGVEYSGETAHRHTGEGKLCSEAANEGKFKPCACPPENWKMDPPDNNPGQHEVACQKCGNCWSVNIGGSADEKKGKGRPRGSKNKKTLEAEAAAAATAAANGTANGIVAETPENKAKRDEALGRAPDKFTDELARLKASRASAVADSNGTASKVDRATPSAAKDNLSQLVTDLSKLGLALNLVTVTGWTSMQIDLARAWAMHPEHDKPEFLQAASETSATLPAPPPVPSAPAPAPAEAAKSRFTF